MNKEEEVDPSLEKLFEQQAQLYDLGARNFLFIDVPTVHRSPAGNVLRYDRRCTNLNVSLCRF